MKLRMFAALWCGKFVYTMMRILRRKASYFPGYLALKICPDYLKEISKPEKVICVSGTDGKTTTANLIADMLARNEKRVVTNRAGSNTNVGAAAALTNCVNLLGQVRADVVVLEVDEHWTRVVFPQIRPDYLIVTNIIRDSLKRNAHPEYVFSKINRCGVPGMKVILNADELCSSQLLPECERVYFGIDRLPTDLERSENLVNDYRLCPVCGEELVYDYVRYCHIGHCHCPACGFASKEADCHITAIDYEKETVCVKNGTEEYVFPLINDSLFNIYNEIAVITLFLLMGYTQQQLAQTLEQSKITETRYSRRTVGGVDVFKIMAKSNNSIPVSLVFDYIRKKPGNKALVLALDDYDERKASEFVGWIYDTDYEFLNCENIRQFIVTGPRCYDSQVRLLLAGVSQERIVCQPDEMTALEKLAVGQIDAVYILHDMSSYPMSVAAENKVVEILEGKQ
jgi:predicted RNA-binding Zn-ribbon protein involved in translation (DUF1610 family)